MTTHNRQPDIIGPGFTAEIKSHVADTLKEGLIDEKYRLFAFDHVDIEERTDYDGQFYLHAYIVFDGDESKLDPDWTSMLITRIRPELIKRGLPMVLSKSFIAKSDWESRKRVLAE